VGGHDLPPRYLGGG